MLKQDRPVTNSLVNKSQAKRSERDCPKKKKLVEKILKELEEKENVRKKTT